MWSYDERNQNDKYSTQGYGYQISFWLQSMKFSSTIIAVNIWNSRQILQNLQGRWHPCDSSKGLCREEQLCSNCSWTGQEYWEADISGDKKPLKKVKVFQEQCS